MGSVIEFQKRKNKKDEEFNLLMLKYHLKTSQKRQIPIIMAEKMNLPGSTVYPVGSTTCPARSNMYHISQNFNPAGSNNYPFDLKLFFRGVNYLSGWVKYLSDQVNFVSELQEF